MIRLVEGGVAVGFGAADALVAAKLSGKGPGGVAWPVYLEGAGILAGLFGEHVGLPAEVRDPLAIASLTLAGRRLSAAAVQGNLLSGPASWGGAHGGFSAGDRYRSDPDPAELPAAAAASIRLLPGRSASQSSFGMSPTLFEAAGVTG